MDDLFGSDRKPGKSRYGNYGKRSVDDFGVHALSTDTRGRDDELFGASGGAGLGEEDSMFSEHSRGGSYARGQRSLKKTLFGNKKRAVSGGNDGGFEPGLPFKTGRPKHAVEKHGGGVGEDDADDDEPDVRAMDDITETKEMRFDPKKTSSDEWLKMVARIRQQMQSSGSDVGSTKFKLVDYQPLYATREKREALIAGVKARSTTQNDYPGYRHPRGFQWISRGDTRLRAVLGRYQQGVREFSGYEFGIVHAYAHDQDLQLQLKKYKSPTYNCGHWVRSTQYDGCARAVQQKYDSYLSDSVFVAADAPRAEQKNMNAVYTIGDEDAVVAQSVAQHVGGDAAWAVCSPQADRRTSLRQFRAVSFGAGESRHGKDEGAAAGSAELPPHIEFGRVPTTPEILREERVRVFTTDFRYNTTAKFRHEIVIYGLTAHAIPRSVAIHITDHRPCIYVTVPVDFGADDAALAFANMNAHLSHCFGRTGLVKSRAIKKHAEYEEDVVRASYAGAWKSFCGSAGAAAWTSEQELIVLSVEAVTKYTDSGWMPDRNVRMFKVVYAHPFFESDVRRCLMKLHDKALLGEGVSGRLLCEARSFQQLVYFHEGRIDPVVRFLADSKHTGLSSLRWLEIPRSSCVFVKSSPYGMSLGAAEWPAEMEHAAEGENYVNIELFTSKAALEVFPYDLGDASSALGDMRTMTYDIETPCPIKTEFPQPLREAVTQVSVVFANSSSLKRMHRIIITVGSCLPIPDAVVVECSDEIELFKAFVNITRRYDPDFIMQFNGNNFDNPYMEKRFAWLCEWLKDRGEYDARFPELRGRDVNIMHTVGRRRAENMCGIFEHTFVSQARPMSTSYRHDVVGRFTPDIMEIFKITTNLASHSLNYISGLYLNESKLDIHHTLVDNMQNAGPHTRKKVCDYAIKDSELVVRLVDNRKIVPSFSAISRVCRVTTSSQWINGQQAKVMAQLYLEAHCDNTVISEKEPEIYPAGYGGGFVFEPERGLSEEEIVVLDFASLYPSIMIVWNMCFITLIKKCYEEAYTKMHGEDTYWRSKTGHCFTKLYEGLCVRILNRLWKSRRAARAEQARAKAAGDWAMHDIWDMLQLEMKKAMNSLYGFCGAVTGARPCLEIAESVTTCGQDFIKLTCDYIHNTFYNRNIIREHLSLFSGFSERLREKVLASYDEVCRRHPEPEARIKAKLVLEKDPYAYLPAEDRLLLEHATNRNKERGVVAATAGGEKKRKAAALEPINDPNSVMFKRPDPGSVQLVQKNMLGLFKRKARVLESVDNADSGMPRRRVAESVQPVQPVQESAESDNPADCTKESDVVDGSLVSAGRMPKYSIDELAPEEVVRVLAVYMAKYDIIKAKVVYGDTDSVMVHTMFRTSEEFLCAAFGKMAEIMVNRDLFAKLKPVEQEFEKIFTHCLLLNKKRYATRPKIPCYTHMVVPAAYAVVYGEKSIVVAAGTRVIDDITLEEKKKSKPADSEYAGPAVVTVEKKGLETVRRDNFEYLRIVATWVLQKIVADLDIAGATAYVEQAVARLWLEQVPVGMLCMSRGYNKDAQSYAAQGATNQDGSKKSLPPHVAFVEKFNRENPTQKIVAGSRVSYIHTATGGNKSDGVNDKFVALWKGMSIDTKHYVEKVLDCVQRILAPVIGREKMGALYARCMKLPRRSVVNVLAQANGGRRVDISIDPGIFAPDQLRAYLQADRAVVDAHRRAVVEQRRANNPGVAYDDAGYEVDEGGAARSMDKMLAYVTAHRECVVCGTDVGSAAAPGGLPIDVCTRCVRPLAAAAAAANGGGEELGGDAVEKAYRAFRTYAQLTSDVRATHAKFEEIWKTCVACGKANDQTPETCDSRDCSVLVNRTEAYLTATKAQILLANAHRVDPPVQTDYSNPALARVQNECEPAVGAKSVLRFLL